MDKLPFASICEIMKTPIVLSALPPLPDPQERGPSSSIALYEAHCCSFFFFASVLSAHSFERLEALTSTSYRNRETMVNQCVDVVDCMLSAKSSLYALIWLYYELVGPAKRKMCMPSSCSLVTQQTNAKSSAMSHRVVWDGLWMPFLLTPSFVSPMTFNKNEIN